MAWHKNKLLNAEKRTMNDGSGGVNFSAAMHIGRVRNASDVLNAGFF